MRWLPLLFVLCGCATLKQDFQPLPAQSEACLKSQLTLSNAVTAAQCLQMSDPKAAEACWEAWGGGLGLSILQCEALALWQDLHHSAQVGNATGMAAATVQANAQVYLLAKGVIVRTPSHP